MLINNKKIAIVGPTSISTDKSCEIEQYDIIIRLNASKENSLFENKGYRTNISNYNFDNGRYLINHNNEFINEFDYCVFSSSEAPKKLQNNGITKVNSRTMRRFPFEFAGGYNMIQKTILDIISFQPRKLKIYGINFFLKSNSYERGYKPQIILKKLCSYLANFYRS